MKSSVLFIAAVFCLFVLACADTGAPTPVDYSDIERFWQTYDLMVETDDMAGKRKIFRDHYLGKGSIGLAKIMQARNYTIEEYLHAIENYPEFWKSIRPHTLQVSEIASGLEAGISELREIYPQLTSRRIYFTIGALRTNGTILGGDLLIGSELAFATPQVVSSELVQNFPHLPAYFETNPKQNITALVLHEYIHTQQSEGGGYDLLSQALYEGVAEYAATAAIGRISSVQAVRFGKENDALIKAHFAEEMFSPWFTHWLWNSPDNRYGVRDLAYYVGYAIAEQFVGQSPDRIEAIQMLIELEYSNRKAVESIVEASGYFDQPLQDLRRSFEVRRPVIAEFFVEAAERKGADKAQVRLTIRFSDRMDPCCASADYGPKGETYYPKLESMEFSDDGTQVSYLLTVEPGREYQMTIQDNFRSIRALPLQQQIIEFTAPE